MNLSRTKITFLKDVPSYLEVDKTSGWNHHYFQDLSIAHLSEFIKLIMDDRIYMIIPLFGVSKLISNATLNLSEPFLVDNKSNTALIIKFIVDQWKTCGFDLKSENIIYFSIKFKIVTIKYK